MCFEKTERKKLPYNTPKWQREIYKTELFNWKKKKNTRNEASSTNESLKNEKRKTALQTRSDRQILRSDGYQSIHRIRSDLQLGT